VVIMEEYYRRYLWFKWIDITFSTSCWNGGILLAVPLVTMVKYYSKFIIFTEATPPQNMQIWWRSVSY
jgi:hypothetical protein